MFVKLKSSPILILCILVQLAFATDSLPQPFLNMDGSANQEFFHSHARRFPTMVQGLCKTDRVGQFLLKDLIGKASLPTWVAVPEDEVPVIGTNGGNWARYEGKGIIRFNVSTLMQAQLNTQRQVPELISLMAFHETLRALDYGLQEDKYEISLAFMWLAISCDIDPVLRYLAVGPNSISTSPFSTVTGGSTFTGGGGSDVAMYLKVAVLSVLRFWNHKEMEGLFARDPILREVKPEMLISKLIESDLEIRQHLPTTNHLSVTIKNGRRQYLIPDEVFYGAGDSAAIQSLVLEFLHYLALEALEQ